MIFLSSKIEAETGGQREGECERGEDKENLIKGQRNREEGGGGRDETKTEQAKAPHMFCKHFS